MYIQNDTNIGFGRLYRGLTVKNILNKKHSAKFDKELKNIETEIRKKNLHKKENVDIILNYNKSDGFFGTISSKKEGVPMNPANSCPVKPNEKSINCFTDWVNGWDEAYSPERLKQIHEVFDFIKGLRN